MILRFKVRYTIVNSWCFTCFSSQNWSKNRSVLTNFHHHREHGSIWGGTSDYNIMSCVSENIQPGFIQCALNRIADNKTKTIWLQQRQLTGGNRPHIRQTWASYQCQQDPKLFWRHPLMAMNRIKENTPRASESGGGRRLMDGKEDKHSRILHINSL